MSRRDARRRLESLGAAPPDDDFVDTLAGRLRAIGVPAPQRRPVVTLRRVLVPAGVLAAAALVALVMARPAGIDAGAVRLAGSIDAVVVMPDGSRVRARSGLVAPEGSVIETGPSGSVRADGEVIGPNSRARVEDGHVVQASRTTALPPTRSPQPKPSPEPTVAPRPTPAIGVTPVDTPAPTPVPSPRPVAGTMKLACEPLRGAIRCTWSASQDPAFASYALWRGDTEKRVVFRSEDRSATSYIDTPAPGEYAYLIQALDREGHVIASGGPVRMKSA